MFMKHLLHTGLAQRITHFSTNRTTKYSNKSKNVWLFFKIKYSNLIILVGIYFILYRVSKCKRDETHTLKSEQQVGGCHKQTDWQKRP